MRRVSVPRSAFARRRTMKSPSPPAPRPFHTTAPRRLRNSATRRLPSTRRPALTRKTSTVARRRDRNAMRSPRPRGFTEVCRNARDARHGAHRVVVRPPERRRVVHSVAAATSRSQYGVSFHCLRPNIRVWSE